LVLLNGIKYGVFCVLGGRSKTLLEEFDDDAVGEGKCILKVL
jgi:hypothetical protein